MKRRDFLLSSMSAAGTGIPLPVVSSPLPAGAAPDTSGPRVAVLLVDTDRVTRPIDERIYGQFLEHINHSVEDGLFAEQIRGAGFEGKDFKTYWEPFSGSRQGRGCGRRLPEREEERSSSRGGRPRRNPARTHFRRSGIQI